jgi:hypothetical protein
MRVYNDSAEMFTIINSQHYDGPDYLFVSPDDFAGIDINQVT